MESKLSLNQAAKDLESLLRPFRWFISVGVGTFDNSEALFVYVKSRNHPELASLEKGWKGFRVLVRAVGAVRPLGSKKSHQLSAL